MRRKIKKKGITLIVLAIIILILLKSVIGYLPIIGKIIAEKRLSAYVSLKDGNQKKIETKYEFYNTKYQSISGNLSYMLQSNTIYDREVSEQVNSDSLKDYARVKNEFPQNLSFPKINNVWTEISAEDYSIKSQKLYILGVYNTEDIAEEESQKMCAIIAEKFTNLMGKEYNFTGIQIIYYDKNRGYECDIDSNGFKKLEYDEILSRTKKVDRLPEEYLDWLAKQ